MNRRKPSRFTLIACLVGLVTAVAGINHYTRAQEIHSDSVETTVSVSESTEHTPAAPHETEKKFNPGEMIFEHILDAHDWHLWGEGHNSVSIPLPVILYSKERGLDIFSSSHFHHKTKTYKGYMLYRGPSEKKYNIVAVNEMEEIDAVNATINKELTATLWDFSITKNVVSLIVSCMLLLWMFIAVAKAYTRREGMAPKGIQSLIEPLILLVRDDIAKTSISHNYEKFVPYLLMVFFFILINNLLGLIPIFPGGANLTGNISITLTLAMFTFILQMANSKKAFWHHVFAMPGIPKGVLVILTPIEILGVFQRPFVLMVRLFANITAGHIVVLVFVSLIFIFNQMFGAAGGYSISVVSALFSVFMGFLEMLVSFLQAYVFTLLSAIYFGAAVEEHHYDTPGHDAKVEEAALV